VIAVTFIRNSAFFVRAFFMKIQLTIIGLLTCTVCFGAGDDGAVRELFNKVLDSYRNASAFSCEGDITTSAKGSLVQSKKTFTLSFDRPSQFDLELVENTPLNQSRTNRIFILGEKPYSQVAPSFQRKEEPSLYQALRTCR
jgi:hypothetical protein